MLGYVPAVDPFVKPLVVVIGLTFEIWAPVALKELIGWPPL